MTFTALRRLLEIQGWTLNQALFSVVIESVSSMFRKKLQSYCCEIKLR